MIDKDPNGAPSTADDACSSASPEIQDSDVHRGLGTLSGSPRSSLDLGQVDLLARGVIAASPFCVLAIVGACGVESWPLVGPLGFIKVLNPRMLTAPYPSGLGNLGRPAQHSPVGVTSFVPGMDACLHLRGHAADIPEEHARSFTIAVEGASLYPCPIVLLPSSRTCFEVIADALPRFDELVLEPGVEGAGHDYLHAGFDKAG